MSGSSVSRIWRIASRRYRLSPSTWSPWRLGVDRPNEPSRFNLSIYPGFMVLDWRPTNASQVPLSKTTRKPKDGPYALGATLSLCLFCSLPILFLSWLCWPISALEHPRPRSLRDLVALIAAAFGSVLFHEWGHARAASRHGMSPDSVGAILLLGVLPLAAYVKLPSDALAQLIGHHRLEVVCAGISHNAALLALAWAVATSGLSSVESPVYGWMGYKDFAHEGVIVQAVSAKSPLADLLPTSSLILQLNDVDLHDSAQNGHWDNFLQAQERKDQTDPEYQREEMGWCVPLDRLSSTVSACCGGAVDSEAPRSVSDTTAMKAVCFAADPSSGIPQDAVLKYCLDPATVLQYQRCFGTCSTETQACVRPVPEARLLRITVKRSDREQVEVIFYQGPKEDVWNDVKVGRWRASAWAWQGLPLSAERFWLFLVSVNASLVVFNLLPLRMLDGAEILAILLERTERSLPGIANDMPRSRHEQLLRRLQQTSVIQHAAARPRSASLVVQCATAAGLAVYAFVEVSRSS